MAFDRKDLLAIAPLSADEITSILDAADGFAEVSRREVKKVPTLRGKTVVNCFFEASTRTRVSFEIAEKRLSADAVNISASGSSVAKGETLLDTVKNVEAMAPDVVVIRHGAAGAADFVARRIRAAVVNAGDGRHEHPTQALLDLFTIRKHKGRVAGADRGDPRRHRQQPCGPLRTSTPSPSSAPKCACAGRPPCCRRRWSGWGWRPRATCGRRWRAPTW